jgi:TolB protein
MPSWSPNAETIVFFSRRESDRRSRVYQVNVVGGEHEMWREGGPVLGEYPAWGRDGRIVYRELSEQITLTFMNADGSEPRTVLADGSAIAPSVSPDGKQVAVMSKRNGNWDIYVVGADGSGLTRLTTHEADDGLPAWAPDGSTIAFVSNRDEEWAMWATTPDGGAPERLFVLPGSPDGKVAGEPDFSSAGWYEERVTWGR